MNVCNISNEKPNMSERYERAINKLIFKANFYVF